MKLKISSSTKSLHEKYPSIRNFEIYFGMQTIEHILFARLSQTKNFTDIFNLSKIPNSQQNRHGSIHKWSLIIIRSLCIKLLRWRGQIIHSSIIPDVFIRYSYHVAQVLKQGIRINSYLCLKLHWEKIVEKTLERILFQNRDSWGFSSLKYTSNFYQTPKTP